MDWLTFFANVIDSLAWPAAVALALLVFRTPMANAISSLKRLRFKDLEAELVEPQEAGDQEISAIVSYLQRSPHSFQWFRDNTEFQYTDQEFESLVNKHSDILKSIRIVSRDENKRRIIPGLPGLRLTEKGKEVINKALK